MSQENVEIVRRVFEAFSRPGRPPIELFDPEVEVWESPEFPQELAGKGYDNLVRANETLFDAFDELSAEWERFFDLSDRILVFVRILGFGKGSGARVEAPQAHLFRLQDGKVTEWCLFIDRSKALEAAGLSEAMSQENVEAFRRQHQAWNRNDLDAWIECFDPEVQWSALLEEFRGHAGIRRAWQSFKVDLQLKARFDDIRDLGDSVLALGELTGSGRTTGLKLSAEIAQLAAFRDGKILSFRDFASHAEALEAAGLRG